MEVIDIPTKPHIHILGFFALVCSVANCNLIAWASWAFKFESFKKPRCADGDKILGHNTCCLVWKVWTRQDTQPDNDELAMTCSELQWLSDLVCFGMFHQCDGHIRHGQLVVSHNNPRKWMKKNHCLVDLVAVPLPPRPSWSWNLCTKTWLSTFKLLQWHLHSSLGREAKGTPKNISCN